MCDNQCCAYSGNGRCINNAVGSSNHCQVHRPKATKLYFKYKSLCEIVRELDLNKYYENIHDQYDYIMDCYCKLNKAYEARQKHRQYAFVPECYDDGHEYQFTKLNQQMEECEKILESLDLSNNDNNDSNNDSSNDSSESCEEEIVVKNNSKKIVHNYKQYRIKKEAEIEALINHYINENKLILRERDKLILLISDYVEKLYETADTEDEMSLFVKNISTYNLTHGLYESGYFNKQFKPDRCNDMLCGCYLDYDAVLGCACVRLNNSIYKYYHMLKEATIIKYYEVILLNKNKLIPLLKDVMELYHKFGEGVIFLKVHLVWSPDLKRLKVEENLYEEPPKMSKVMSQTRLKNKYYQQRIQQEYLTGKMLTY
jgi:hypothetical protein